MAFLAAAAALIRRLLPGSYGWLLALLMTAAPSWSQGVSSGPKRPSADSYQVNAEQYARAREAFAQESGAYWRSIIEKRQVRNAKRRSSEPIGLDDYVLSQPPVYKGPPPPVAPKPGPGEPRPPAIPVVADFLKAAAEQFGFVPQWAESETAFKKAYAKAAAAAGLTREQVVRIYAFETGGNGTFDAQAGLTPRRPGARAISPAIGYNQLLSTNSVELIAEHGDQLIESLRQKAGKLTGAEQQAMAQKVEAVRRMVALSRTVPDAWSEHDKLAKNTPGGLGIHAAILDRDIGPWLQARKLLDSVLFARSKGHRPPLTAAELEMMNLTGDGNGLDMVMMPPEMRRLVPTANFFQQSGYERNPIARRTGVVAALFATIDAKMDEASKARGAKELAAAF